MDFTKRLVEEVETKSIHVAQDRRASGEKERILQAWSELEAVSQDILNGSEQNSRATLNSIRTARSSTSKKSASYTQLSRSRDPDEYLTPPMPGGR